MIDKLGLVGEQWINWQEGISMALAHATFGTSAPDNEWGLCVVSNFSLEQCDQCINYSCRGQQDDSNYGKAY